MRFAQLLAAALITIATGVAHANPLTGTINAPDADDVTAAVLSISLLNDEGRIVASTYPDKDGAFDFDVKPGAYTLRIIADMPYLTRQTSQVEIPQDGAAAADVTLAKAPEVTVVVVDPQGRPVPDARLRTLVYVGADEATSDDMGRANLRIGIAEGADVHVAANGFIDAHTLVAAGDGEQRIPLQRGREIRGRINNAPDDIDGKPVRITFQPASGVPATQSGTVNADGTFAVTGFPEGLGRLGVLIDGVGAAIADRFTVTPDGADLGAVNADFARSLDVLVNDAFGNAIPNATVAATFDAWTFFRFEATADESGRARLRGMLSGTYHVAANPGKGWRPAEQHNVAVAGETPVTIEMQPGRAIQLNATLARGNGPAPAPWEAPDAPPLRITVTAQSVSPPPLREEWFGIVTPGGAVHIPEARAGLWHLIFELDEWRGIARDVTIPEPKEADAPFNAGEVILNAPQVQMKR